MIHHTPRRPDNKLDPSSARERICFPISCPVNRQHLNPMHKPHRRRISSATCMASSWSDTAPEPAASTFGVNLLQKGNAKRRRLSPGSGLRLSDYIPSSIIIGIARACIIGVAASKSHLHYCAQYSGRSPKSSNLTVSILLSSSLY